jgi:NAD(P)-dependent dehydrogenase (short-subunit alcohol dehydrogenase family)
MTQLAAQTALVTGANRGLGREFVHQLLARGVAMVYAGHGTRRRSSSRIRASYPSNSTSPTWRRWHALPSSPTT